MRHPRAPKWLKRSLWLIALWVLGVAALGGLALLLKWAMRAAGLGG